MQNNENLLNLPQEIPVVNCVGVAEYHLRRDHRCCCDF